MCRTPFRGSMAFAVRSQPRGEVLPNRVVRCTSIIMKVLPVKNPTVQQWGAPFNMSVRDLVLAWGTGKEIAENRGQEYE